MKILHTGDLHIGSFPGPEKNGENARFLDICNCLNALIDGAKEQKPDIAVIAGDLFHAARTWADRGLTEVKTAIGYLRELEKVCPVVVMRGTPNHDGEKHFEMLKTAFKGDGDIRIITEPEVVNIYTGAWGWIQIACLPGFDRGYYRAKHPGLSKEEENEVFTQSIEDMIIGLKAQCDKNNPTVLVSHFTVTGCNMESGQTAFFSQFEPAIYPSTLQAADFDLVCLGHIHRPQKLEGCKNAYYCGAISALNFNDEGQKRGYYIHEIRGEGEVTSTFYELPTREFCTLYFDDKDIADFISTRRMIILKPFQDKIVRVIYNCTDEHNKAFNHAILEKQLYDIGAFYVSEITPEKITTTVDKNGLDAADSPEENLIAYLSEKNYAPEQIGELIELARPIIAEAMERATVEHRTGIFTPVEIEVKNYRNYRDETFSYDGIRFCTINGQNGVGKSSLFMDAILDCLYEEPREGDLTGWICNDSEVRSGAIKFTFKLGEKTYRVTRTRQKSGKATLNIAEFVDGEWVDRSKEKFKDTQTEIINILGIDSLTLKACALIMQDQYGLFLQADKEARMNILGNILGLSVYERMESLAANKATDANREIRMLEDRAEHIMDGLRNAADLETQIEMNNSLYENTQEQANQKQRELEELRGAADKEAELKERILTLRRKEQSLAADIAAKESSKSMQTAIIGNAMSVLNEEETIMDGVKEYNRLVEEEKAAIAANAECDNLERESEKYGPQIYASEKKIKELTNQKSTLTIVKIGPLVKVLEREEELARMHNDYMGARNQLEAKEALMPAYNAEMSVLTTAKEELSRATIEYGKKVRDIESRIEALAHRAQLLENSECIDPDNAHCKFLADAIEAKGQLPSTESELKALKEEQAAAISAAQETVRRAEVAVGDKLDLPGEIERLRDCLRSLEIHEREYNGLEAAKREMASLEDQRNIIDGAIKDETANHEQLMAVCAEIVDKLNKAKAVNEQSYGGLERKLAVAHIWVEKEKKLPVAREQMSTAENRIKELDAEIVALDDQRAQIAAEIEEAKKDMPKMENLPERLAEAADAFRRLNAMAREYISDIGGLKKELEQAKDREEQAEAIRDEINTISVKAAGYEELKRAFSQDGIPHNIIRTIIPVFEATATNILGQMSGGKMSVEFVTEKVLKSNNKKEVTTLDIVINDCDTGRLPYMSRSGGERVKAALSVILALSEIKSSKAGIQLGFLFIDEPPFLDEQGVQAYCDALEAIQARYSELKIMAITHDPAMKSRFPQSVDVIKTQQGSKVVYE